MADLSVLQSTLGINFRDLSLLQQSLVHRSYLNENPDFGIPSNERLEFLGDALLGFAVAEKLYEVFPTSSEGELTKIRAALVQKDTLARLAKNLELGNYLYLGRGEESSGGRHRQSNLASTLEAVLGAIFADQGFACAKDFIFRMLGEEVDRAAAESTDYKSRLQEIIQSKRRRSPVYRTIEATGPNHGKVFTVEVLVEDEVIGRGSGKSKQMAEKEAARVALEALGSEV